ncbi:hypothetical protein J1614_009912 [Plenodomus biglobosus]|nr:hypothetical protein J1614_009912 [Plenodomus biglobosus]
MDPTKLDPAMLAYIPAGIAPNGTTSNLVNPPSRDSEVLIVMYVALPIMFIPLILRLYTRVFITKNFGADDYLVIISAICVGGYCGVLHHLMDGAMGEHVWDVSLAAIGAGFQKSNLASQVIFGIAALFTKTTLLVLYLRIFHPSYHARIMIWTGIAVIASAYIALAIASVVVYTPPPGHEEEWGMTKDPSDATKLMNITAASGLFGVVSDFYILFIPLHLVVGLHLPFGRKLGVCGIFATGLLACVCSIVGCVYRFQIRLSQDPLWDSATPYALGIVELNAGIICSCMPILLVFFKRTANNKVYTSLRRWVRSRRSQSSTEGDDQGVEERKNSDEIQLTIPKAAMTGLRSFIRKANRSQPEPSYQVESYNELDSINDDYNEHLRADRKKASSKGSR